MRTIDPDSGDLTGSTAEKDKNLGGRPKKVEGGKHYKTAAAETKYANSLKDIIQAMHGQHRSIREFLHALFTNPQLDSAL